MQDATPAATITAVQLDEALSACPEKPSTQSQDDFMFGGGARRSSGALASSRRGRGLNSALGRKLSGGWGSDVGGGLGSRLGSLGGTVTARRQRGPGRLGLETSLQAMFANQTA